VTHVRWEYAQVSFTNNLRKITRADPEWERLPPETSQEYDEKDWQFCWWTDWTWWITLPGKTAEPDKRHGWSTFEKDHATRAIDILNELGADGWEVVTHIVAASAMGTNRGRERAAFPIETSYVLKRAMTE
jgi:hypothetical protein